MKKILLLLFLSLIFSCSTEAQPREFNENEQNEEKQDNEVKTAGFQLGGEFVNSSNRNETSKTENADLFVIQFFSADSQKPYAHVMGTDISKVKLDFFIGQSYRMALTYITNGQNLIPNHKYHWGAPFSRSNNQPAPFHEVFYSSEIRMWLSSPAINLKTAGGTYLEAERLHGIIENFEVQEGQDTFVVNLKKMVFGLTLNVEELKAEQDSVYFSVNSTIGRPREYYLVTKEGTGSLTIPFITLGFPNHTDTESYETAMDRAAFSENEYQERVHISIGTPNHHTLYFDDFITVSRNKMIIINLKPDEGEQTSSNGVDITFEEEMIEKYIEITGNQ